MTASPAADHAACGPPAWFREATSTGAERASTLVEGCRIRSLSWGRLGNPALVLVHGGGAHAGWWGFVAPRLLPTYRVVALDLSGHGDSEHRPAYTFRSWGEEVLAVARGQAGTAPVIVGHSMGGIVAAVAAAAGGDEVAGLISVDAPLHEPRSETLGDADVIFQRPKRYPTVQDAERRFRLLPPQPVVHPALVRYAAERSLRAVDGGWTWKFDPVAFARPPADRPQDVGHTLAGSRCPVGAIVGQLSPIVPPGERERLRRLTCGPWGPDPASYVEVPDGHHHLMFDRPLELVAAVTGLLERWGMSAPRA